jgi:hypothetical protein
VAAIGWFGAPNYTLARLVLQRGVGLIYLIAFVVTAAQFRPLVGEHGLEPISRVLRSVPFRRSPSLFYLRYSDRLLMAVSGVGIVLSGAVVIGLVGHTPLWACLLVWALLWILYLSIVNVGQTFYGFGWETLLLEAGFLAIFLGSRDTAPPALVLWLFRWLVFRVEFGAGLIKLRGDPCWRDLTCLYYHHQTQPLPNPLSWHFHHLPKPLHRVEVLANHVAQLIVPFGLFAPQPIAGGAAAVIILTQCWLVLSGNFAWLNAITIVIAASALPNGLLGHLRPEPAAATATPYWWVGAVVAVTAVVLVESYRPVHNLLSRRQVMNTSFNSLRLVNTYGAFGHITKTRVELIIEGTDDESITDDTEWLPYEFKAKPGKPSRRPPQIAPYHLRLDWLMWFAAMSSPQAHAWIIELVAKLLENDRLTVRLLRHNPFPQAPPTYVRIMAYRYEFTSRQERRDTGNWWARSLIGPYLGPMSLRRPSMGERATGWFAH